MNRYFFYVYGREEEGWSFSDTLSRWSWSIMCCGVPGVPCSYCSCCKKTNAEEPPAVIDNDSETLSIPICEREVPYRPHALRGRKSTPELMSAVRCALTQLQGQPVPQSNEKEAPEKEAPEKEAPEKEAAEKEAPDKQVLEKQGAVMKGERG